MIAAIQTEIAAAKTSEQVAVQYEFIQDAELVHVGGGNGLVHF